MSTPSRRPGRPEPRTTRALGTGVARSEHAEPWSPQLVRAYGLAAVVGAVVVVVAWYVAAGKIRWEDEEAWVGVAIAGVVLTNAAGATLLGSGRRAVRRRQVALLPYLRLTPASPGNVLAGPATLLVGGEGLRHYHRSTCSFADGRGWPPVPRGQHEAAGRTPCGGCRP